MRLVIVLILVCVMSKTEAQSSVLNRADSLYRHGNYSKAIEAYKSCPNPSEVNNKIARAYNAIGNFDLALDYFKRSVEANPNDALALYEYAKLLAKTKKYDTALASFNQLMNLDYRNPNYHYEMGLVLEKMKDSTAMNRFRVAYDLDATHQKAIFKIAKYHLIKRQHVLSHKYIDKGLESYPNNLKLMSLKAQNYFYQDDYKNARTWFQKLVDLGESSEFIHEKLSSLHAEFSDYELAIEHRKLVLKYNPNNSDALFLIGQYYEHLKDYKQAESYYRMSIQLKDIPLDLEYQKLGYVMNRQDKHKEAIEAYKKAVRENPENITALFFLITTKDKYYEDIDTKIKLYEDFMTKHSESVFAHFAQERIKELKQDKFLKAKN